MANQPRRYREYDRLVKRLTPNSNFLQGYVRAFWVGGLICVIGQLLAYWGEKGLGMVEEDALMFTSVCLIFLCTTTSGATRAQALLCPSRALPIRLPRRPSSFGGRVWSWAWARSCSRWRGQCWCTAFRPRSRWV